MCDGGVISVPLAMAVFAGMQASNQSKAQKAEIEYQEQIELNNAKVMKNQMDEASRQGMAEAEQHLKKVAALKGEQRTSLAARGLSLDGGDAFALLEDTQLLGNEDARTIKFNSDKTRWGYDVERNNRMASAQMLNHTAGNINPSMDGLMAGAKTFAGNASMTGIKNEVKSWGKGGSTTGSGSTGGGGGK